MTFPLPPRVYRLLLIDDSANIHEDFRKILAQESLSELADLEVSIFGDAPQTEISCAQFKIDSAYQGEEGIERFTTAQAEGDPYALAFVDMRMPPGMDGLGVIEKLWKLDPTVQVVICSAYSDYSWKEIIQRVGLNDRLLILRKPFDSIEVLQLAHTLTEKWRLQRTVQCHLDELEQLVAARTSELHQSQALFRLILENTNDLISVTDTNHRLVYSSPAHFRLLGYTSEEINALPAFSCVHPEDIENLREIGRRVLATGRSETATARLLRKDGLYIHSESHLGAVFNDAGQPIFLMIAARDITERHQREVQTRLHQKLESIGLLAAGVAHEINTPNQFIADNTRFLSESFTQLRGLIAGYQHILAGGNLSKDNVAEIAALEKACEYDYLKDEIPRTLEQSLEGLSRVAKIVKSLKEFSHPGTPDWAPMDLSRAIENAVTVCRHEWKYVAELKTHFDPNLPPVPCLADELNQAILNLVINAAHAVAEVSSKEKIKGMISILTRREGEWAVIEISDTGGGIPEAIRHRIFEPFFTTKPMGKGTGQGLAIVRSVIVGKHRGTVDFISEIGSGTTFSIKLPLAAKIPRIDIPTAA